VLAARHCGEVADAVLVFADAVFVFAGLGGEASFRSWGAPDWARGGEFKCLLVLGSNGLGASKSIGVTGDDTGG
jgi:hypothetical protein